MEILVVSVLYTTQAVGALTPDVIIERAFGKQLKRLKTVGAARRCARRQYECATDTRDHPNGSRTLH